MDFSLFYFANNDAESSDRYRLLLEGARFADEQGFAAVWTRNGTSTPSAACIRIRR